MGIGREVSANIPHYFSYPLLIIKLGENIYQSNC